MTHPIKKGLRAGFTLVEILVALIILAVITAFVVPDVISRADDAEAPRLLADVIDLGTGIELFKLDLKTEYPSDIEDLASQIQVATDTSLSSAAQYATNDAAKWRGPYIKSAVINGGSLPTGYNGTIGDNFVLMAVGTETGSLTYEVFGEYDSSDCVASNFLTIAITGLSASNFEDANDLVDGTAEVDGVAPGSSQNLGKLRFKDADVDSTFYLVTPCS